MTYIFKYLILCYLISSCPSILQGKTTKWTTATISSPAPLVETPQIATTAEGEVIACWVADSGDGRKKIFTAYYNPDDGWSSPNILSEDPYNIYSSTLAVDISGNAIILWEAKKDDSRSNIIQFSYFNNFAKNWSKPVNISSQNQISSLPQFSFDSTGNGIAVWINYTRNLIQASSLTILGNELTWSDPIDISAANNHITKPQLVVGLNGKALVIWKELNNSPNETELNEWAASQNKTAMAVSYENIFSKPPTLFVGSLTNKVETCVDIYNRNKNKFVVKSTLYDKNSWQPVVTISDTTADVTQMCVGTGKNGNILVTWLETPTRIARYAIFSDAENTWSSPGTIIPMSYPIFYSALNVSMDTDNAALVIVTYQKNDQYVAALNYNAATNTWSPPVRLSPLNPGFTETPRIAINSKGSVLAFWRRFDGSKYFIESATYSAGRWSIAETLPQATGTVNSFHCSSHQQANSANAAVIWVHTDDDKKYVVQCCISS
jgi:hypothetical protein